MIAANQTSSGRPLRPMHKQQRDQRLGFGARLLRRERARRPGHGQTGEEAAAHVLELFGIKPEPRQQRSFPGVALRRRQGHRRRQRTPVFQAPGFWRPAWGSTACWAAARRR